MNPEIHDDPALLKIMIQDMRHQSGNLYRPGPYWDQKVKNTISEIERCGLRDFRGSSNLIGQSYTDSLTIDIRNSYNFGFRKIIRWATGLFPFNRMFDAQVEQTRNYAVETIRLSEELLNQKPGVRELLGKYRVPYSLLGGCKSAVKIGERDYAIHYLNLLEQHDNVDFSNTV